MILLMYAVRRSGHHGIVNWLCSQFKSAEFYDDGNTSGDKITTRWSKTYSNELSENGNLSMYNFENRNDINLQIGEKFGFEGCKYIVVVRDIYNNLASYCKDADKIKEVRKRNIIQLWKNHATFLLENKDIIGIKFNSWYKDEEYRRNILDLLGIKRLTDDISTIGIKDTRWGRSSFGEDIINDSILSRYESFLREDYYVDFFDEEAVDLNKRLFGFWIDFKSKMVVRI